MKIEEEIRKEYRNAETWLNQAGNMLSTLPWIIGRWMTVTLLMAGVQVIVIILFSDWIPANAAEFRDSVKMVVVLAGSISAIVIFLFEVPLKLKNVFREQAEDRVTRYEKIKSRILSQEKITNNLLLQYRLITRDDIDGRLK